MRAAGAQPESAHAVRRVLVTRVKRETLGSDEAEPVPWGRSRCNGASMTFMWTGEVKKSRRGPLRGRRAAAGMAFDHGPASRERVAPRRDDRAGERGRG